MRVPVFRRPVLHATLQAAIVVDTGDGVLSTGLLAIEAMGALVGILVGLLDGETKRVPAAGWMAGAVVTTIIGDMVMVAMGLSIGGVVGDWAGGPGAVSVGDFVGLFVGALVGLRVSAMTGLDVGATDGRLVGLSLDPLSGTVLVPWSGPVLESWSDLL
jgi:hypothetical protein